MSDTNPAQAALNDQQPCLPDFVTSLVQSQITKAYLVWLTAPGWRFAVKLFPVMEIEVEGNPTWEQILAHFDGANQIGHSRAVLAYIAERENAQREYLAEIEARFAQQQAAE